MTKFFMGFVAVAALSVAVAACGDDDDDEGSTGTSSGTASGSGTGTGTGTGTETGAPAGTGSGTEAGTQAGTASGMASAAEAFCGGFETTCTYGAAGRFADETACTTYFDGASMACQSCIATHLGLAGGDADTHCPHACGEGPCAGDCAMSGCM